MSGAKVNRAAHLVTSTTIAKPRSATSATANSATARLATGGSTTATTTNPVHHRYYHGVSTDIGRKRVNQDVYLVCESLFAVTGVTGAPSSGSASPATTPAIIRAKTSVATRAKTPVVTRAKTPMVTRPGTSGKSSVVREVSAPAPGTASNTGAARRPLMEGNKAHMPSRRATTVTATTTRHDVSSKANNTDKIATFPTVHCYAVLDGHGEHGHIIANYVKDNLLQWFRTDLPRRRRQFFANPAQTITEAFLDVDDRLCSSESIDVWLSGTTCVAVFMWSDRMVVANVGDSRAVLVTGDVGSSPCPLGGMKSERLNDSGYDEARQLELELEAKLHVSHGQTIVQLTTDHTCEVPEERDRLLEAGASLRKLEDIYGDEPVRIFKGPTIQYPGLVVSRAFGDKVAKRLGVTATPEITTRTITSSDQLLIIACDGIWDGLSNAEVVAVVNKHLERCEVMADGDEDEGAWKANVERASRMVTRECLAGLDRKMLDDNCTNICVFLRPVK